MITLEQIEELRQYFAPKIEEGIKLPEVRSVVDGTEFVLTEGTTKKLYKMIKGKWYLINTLTEV